MSTMNRMKKTEEGSPFALSMAATERVEHEVLCPAANQKSSRKAVHPKDEPGRRFWNALGVMTFDQPKRMLIFVAISCFSLLNSCLVPGPSQHRPRRSTVIIEQHDNGGHHDNGKHKGHNK